ncbi:MAG: hypothetical protein ACE5J3_12330, partial [Methanosarcinales archaeon]
MKFKINLSKPISYRTIRTILVLGVITALAIMLSVGTSSAGGGGPGGGGKGGGGGAPPGKSIPSDMPNHTNPKIDPFLMREIEKIPPGGKIPVLMMLSEQPGPPFDV